jgi:hypothetical protein
MADHGRRIHLVVDGALVEDVQQLLLPAGVRVDQVLLERREIEHRRWVDRWRPRQIGQWQRRLVVVLGDRRFGTAQKLRSRAKRRRQA